MGKPPYKTQGGRLPAPEKELLVRFFLNFVIIVLLPPKIVLSENYEKGRHIKIFRVLVFWE